MKIPIKQAVKTAYILSDADKEAEEIARKMREEEEENERLLKKICAGALLLTEVTESGEEKPVGIEASEIRRWVSTDLNVTLLFGYKLTAICAVRESFQEIAKLKELAKRNSKY